MRRTFIFGVLIVVAVTAVWYLFLFSPQINRASDANTQLDTERSTQQTLEARRQELVLLQDQQFAYANGIAQLAASIPEQPDEAALLESLYSLAAENRIELQAVSPSPPSLAADETYYEIPITMTADGTYFDLLAFLFAIEDLERLVRIDNIDLSYQAAVTEVDEVSGQTTVISEGSLTISMTGVAFSKAPLPGGEIVVDEVAGDEVAGDEAVPPDTSDDGSGG